MKRSDQCDKTKQAANHIMSLLSHSKIFLQVLYKVRYVGHYPFIIIFALLLSSISFGEHLFLTYAMVLWDVIWEFECKIYWFMVTPISFNNS
jgi:hypothetical protein